MPFSSESSIKISTQRYSHKTLLQNTDNSCDENTELFCYCHNITHTELTSCENTANKTTSLHVLLLLLG